MIFATPSVLATRSRRLLLLEDDGDLGDLMSTGLALHNWVVDRERYGAAGCLAFARGLYDAVVVDLGLPDMDGTEVIRNIRHLDASMPILIVSGRAEIQDRIKGLDSGADAYLVKPFELDELLARLRSLRLRGGLTRGGLEVAADSEGDLLSQQFTVEGCPIQLTPREYFVLRPFIEENFCLTLAQLREHLGPAGLKEGEASHVNACLTSLRAKLGSVVDVTIREAPTQQTLAERALPGAD